MNTTVLIALGISFAVYLIIGWILGRKTKTVGDLLPVVTGKEAQVRSASEFSASTVATTISLATVIVAFFELAPYLGPWLFWTVITTALGILVVRLVARRVWEKFADFNHRPTLHEFLGETFQSRAVAYVASICTSLGFLGAFAVELTVGSMFLTGLVEGVPKWLVIVVISAVAFLYTSAGGFRAVIVTDRIQMISIWLLLVFVSLFLGWYLTDNLVWAESWAQIPADAKTFSWRAGLTSFLLGIFIINVPTYLADLSIWQRIAGAQKKETVFRGLWASVTGSAITWAAFIGLSILALAVVVPNAEENPLVSLLKFIGGGFGTGGKLVLFFAILGLFGAMLSTASTQLIAVSHTIYEDLFSKFRQISLSDRLISKRELKYSRLILIGAAIISTAIVAFLTYVGFSVADLVFAIYGAQLGLFPPVILALFIPKTKLKGLGTWAIFALGFGFFSGWGSAILGKVIENGDLVFLAPVISLGVSSLIILFGWAISKYKA